MHASSRPWASSEGKRDAYRVASIHIYPMKAARAVDLDGPWWPGLDEVLETARRFYPDSPAEEDITRSA